MGPWLGRWARAIAWRYEVPRKPGESYKYRGCGVPSTIMQGHAMSLTAAPPVQARDGLRYVIVRSEPGSGEVEKYNSIGTLNT